MKKKSQINNFCFICSDNVSKDYLWKDGIHFTEKNKILGVCGKEFIEGEGIKYKKRIELDKKINVYEHKYSDISGCNVSVLDEIRTKKTNRLIVGNLNINSRKD